MFVITISNGHGLAQRLVGASNADTALSWIRKSLAFEKSEWYPVGIREATEAEAAPFWTLAEV